MNAVPVRIETLESGDLPAVCVKTGQPTSDTLRRSFSVTPGWTWILILFGIFPWLIAVAFASVKVRAVLPMSEAAYRRLRAAERTARIAALLAVAAFVVAAITQSAILVWVALALLVVVASALVAAIQRSVGINRGAHPTQVLITRVSAEFARACGQRARSADRTAV